MGKGFIEVRLLGKNRAREYGTQVPENAAEAEESLGMSDVLVLGGKAMNRVVQKELRGKELGEMLIRTPFYIRAGKSSSLEGYLREIRDSMRIWKGSVVEEIDCLR